MVMTTGEVVGGVVSLTWAAPWSMMGPPVEAAPLSRRVCRSVEVRGRLGKASAGGAAHPAGGGGGLGTLPPLARVSSQPRPHLRKGVAAVSKEVGAGAAARAAAGTGQVRKQLQVEGEGYEEESREGDGEPGQGALQAHRGPHVSTCLRSRVIGDPAEPPALHLQELMKMKMMSIPTLLPWGCSRPSPC